MKIFISSISYDLDDYRKAVIGTLIHAGQTPLCMNHIGAGIGRPLDKCLQMVKEADIYVGIVARRYSFVPSGRNRSMTHIEYEEARKLKKPRFIFLLEESADWPKEYEDIGFQAERVKRFRRSLQGEHWCNLFCGSPDRLANSVLSAICREYPPPEPKKFEDLVNPGPDDIARVEQEFDKFLNEPASPAFSVPVSEHFKDREDEIARLHQCLSDQSIRAIIVCGRAGTGKTQLVSKWIQQLKKELSRGSRSRMCRRSRA